MSDHQPVLDLLHEADPVQGDSPLEQHDMEHLMELVQQRTAGWRPVPRVGWQRGALYAATAMAVVVIIGLVLARSAFEPTAPDPAPPATGTTITTLISTTVTTSVTTTSVAGTPATTIPADAGWVWPSPRYLTTVAFDEGSGLLVVFGGTRFEDIGFSDTWVFDPSVGTWTEQDPEVRPPGRMTAAMAYDPGLDRLVMFGGAADRSYVWDDLWLYDVDADVWERVEVEGPKPSARAYASMTYVDSLGGMLLFGGNTGWFLGQGEFGDTWFLDTATMTWTEVEGEGPGARDMAGMAYDPVEDKVVLAGGFQPADSLTWIFDPATMEWTSGVEVPDPLSRLAYDPATGLLVSGGLAYSGVDGTWSTLPWDPSMRDDGYQGIGPILDTRRNVMYFFWVDIPGSSWSMEMWEYDLDTGSFSLIGPDSD